MASRIAGITVEIGGDTTKLQTALKEVNSSIKTTSSQLKDVEKLLKLDPTNTELLTQKQKLLTSAISDTKTKLETLKTASEQAAATKDNYDAWLEKVTPIKEEISKTTTELNNLKKKEEEAAEQFAKGEISAEEFEAVKTSVKETSDHLEDLKAQKKAVDEEFGNPVSGEQYDALQREIIATEQELEKLADQAAEANETLQKISAVSDTLGNVSEKLGEVGTELTTKVTAPIVALGTAAVSTAATFESSMSQVQATMGITADATSELNGEVVNTMDSLSDLAQQMGSETAFSASECAEAINYLALAGYDTQQIYDTLPTVLNLAAAGNMELADASDMVTDAMSALGLETEDADSMVDQMAKTASSTNTSVSQLGEGILTIGATAKSMAGGTAELNTALGILANNGIKGAEGGTHLRNVILALQSPTDEAASLMNDLGVEVYDSEGNMRSLNDILGDLNTSMEDMTSSEKDNIISTIFNKTDLASVNALLANTGDTWDDLQASITDSGGAAQQMADTQLDNLSGQITILKSAVEGLSISFGNALLPAVKKVVSIIQNVVDKLNAMDESQRNAIIRIAAVVAAIGPLFLILSKVTGALSSGLDKFVDFGKKFIKISTQVKTGTGTFGKLATAISSISAPMLAVVAVIGVLVAAFKTLWDNNKTFRIAILTTWNTIKTKISDFISGIQERLSELGISFDGVGGVVETLKNVWMNFCNVLAPLFTGAFSIVSNVLSAVLDTITGLLDIFIGVFTGDWSQAWTGVQEIFGAVWEMMSSTFQTVINTIRSIANVILGWFGTSWNEVWTSVSSFFTEIWTNVSTFFSNLWTDIQTVITTVWTAISGFFTTIFTAIYTTISTIWTNVYNTVTGVWNAVYSVIEPLVTAFGYLFETIFQAIQILIGRAMNAIQNTITSIWNAIVSFLSPLLMGIQTTFTNIWNAITSAITTAVNAAKSVISSVWNAIKSLITPIVNAIKNTVSSAWNTIKSTTSSVFNSVKSIASSVWNAIKSTISNALTSMKTAVSSKLNSIKTTFTNSFNSLKKLATSWGKDIIQNLINGIKSKINALASAVTGVANKIKSILGFSLPEEGPLSDADTYMPDFMELLTEGIQGGMGDVLDKVKTVASEIQGAMFKGLTMPDVSSIQMPELAFAGAGAAGATTTNNTSTTNLGGVNVYVTGTANQDVNSLADAVVTKINNMLDESSSVYK